MSEPRPIQIWMPVDERWVRPSPGQLGDHYSANPVLRSRRGAEKRVVLVGESVAAGYLYAPHYTPAKALAAVMPQWDVIDLARTNESLASLLETTAAAMQLEPDVVVMWAGNNWMLRDLGRLSPYHPRSDIRTKLGELLADDGLEAIGGATHQWVRTQVLSTLAEIHRTVVGSGSRLVVVVPEVNLIDWEHGQPVTVLPAGDEPAWYRARDARDHQAMSQLDHGSNATTHRLASMNSAHPDLAALRREVEASCGPLRGTTSAPMVTQQIQNLLREWVADHDLATVDVAALIEAAGDFPDRAWFLDYCHHTAAAITTIAKSIAGAVEVDDVNHASPDDLVVASELQAVAALGALMHTDHRLAMTGDRRPLLRHWRVEAERVWPNAHELMRDLIDSRLGGAPVPLTQAQRRNRMRPFPFGFAHGWRPHTTEADALWTLGMTQADATRLELSTERAWPNARMWRPGEQRWNEEQPFSRTPGFLRSIAPRSHFGVLVKKGKLQVALTARVPHPGSATVAVGAWSTTMAVETGWTTHRFTVPPAASDEGLQPLTITWPELPEGPDRWSAALTDLANDRTPDLHPIFGEVFSLQAG